jgi:hypothetical protein
MSKPPRFWSRTCAKTVWMTLLCGATCSPSTLDAGAERWIWSLRDSHASPSPSQASEPAEETPAGSGQKSLASSLTAALRFASWRTFRVSSPPDSKTSFSTSMRWGSMRSGACTPLPKPTRLTGETAGSVWPTPGASVRTGFNRSPSAGAVKRPLLAEIGRRWPTPTAMDSRASGAAGYAATSKRNSGTTLTDAAVRRMWATPTARDWKDGSNPSELAPTNGLLGRQAPRSSIIGVSICVCARALNPLFVEALMGLPRGWTDFASLATELSRSRPPSLLSTSLPAEAA